MTLAVADFQVDQSRRRRDAAMRRLLQLAALTSVLITALIVASLIRETWTFLTEVDLATLTDIGWFPRRGLFDVGTLLVGSLLVTGVAMLIATPLGLGAAVYLSEYSAPRVRRIVKPLLEVLAGVPSVVIGFFVLAWVSPQVVQRLFTGTTSFSLLAAGIGVGILTVPLVASVAEDALRAVPDSLREAASALGAPKHVVTLKIVVPAAVSGLSAALIVGISRAIGETMVVAIAAGASGGSLFGLDVTESGQTMTAAMASMAAGTDQVAGDNLAFQSLFFVGSVLFVITLALNVGAQRFVRRVRRVS